MGVIRSKPASKEGLKERIQEYNSRLQTALIGCNQAKTTFVTLSDLWAHSRSEVVTTLTSVADEIDRHHHNVNLATLTGTTSSIAGGTAAIAGMVFAPFTGGLSVALSAGGLVGTVAGSATTLGANIAEVVLTRELMEKAKKVLDTDTCYTDALRDAFKELIIHENEVLAVLAELKDESMTDELKKLLKSIPHIHGREKKINNNKCVESSLGDLLNLAACLYPEDEEFLLQLDKTDRLFSETPSLSSALSSSSGFFQSMKELTIAGPETLKSLSGAALQSSAASTAQMASLGTQIITAGLEAVFVALDIYQFLKTSKNYDKGSKTELAQRIRNVVKELKREKDQVEKLSEFYKQQTTLDEYLF